MITDMLYDYQIPAAERIVKQRRVGLFDEPGLGKTIITLAALEQDGLFDREGARILVLAPKTGAALTWGPTAEKLVPVHVNIVEAHTGLLKARMKKIEILHKQPEPMLVLGNHALIETSDIRKADASVYAPDWDAIIIDESHRVLPTSEPSDWTRTQFWKGLLALRTPPSALRIPLSGTPDRGKLENRYGTWKFMMPEAYAVDKIYYEKWLMENFYTTYKRVRVGRGYVEQLVPIGLKDEEGWLRMEKSLTIRRTKREVAPWLPEKQYLDIELPHPLKLKQAYDAYLKEFRREDDGSQDAADTFRIRATQFAICEFDIAAVGRGSRGTPILGSVSPKRDWIIEWLTERDFQGDSDGRVVIVSQFSSVLRWLQEELRLQSFPSVLLDGSLSTGHRLDVQKSFQLGDGPRILLLNMSLGDSIDLDAADDMVFVDLVNDPDVTTQVEDRIHRVSRDHKVFIWRLRSRGTVDEAIVTANQKAYDTTRALMDGARDVEYERSILARIRVRSEIEELTCK